MTATRQIGNLSIAYNEQSGQILNIRDRVLDMDVIAFRDGHELEINKLPLPMTLVNQDDNPRDPAWQCNLRSVRHPVVGCAQGFDIFRQVVVGSAVKPGGNHINPPNSLHVRYRLDRAQVNRYADPVPHSAGQRPIQMPLWLDTIGTLCAGTDWFGPETRLLQATLSGCGPRAHVGLDDGLVKDVVPVLWNMYRRSAPGLQTFPGGIYYHPDGRWLWITCQRSTVGMHWDYAADALKAQFQYHARLGPAEIVHTPEVSLYWGRGGRSEMLARLNENFVLFEEPPDWLFHTTWFWLHWWHHRPRGYDDMIEHAKILNGELGLTGFGLTSHDLRPGSWDCGPSGMRPSPHVGGDAGLRRLGAAVKAMGGRMYAHFSYLGLQQPSLDLREHWRIRGEDGRPYESFHIGSYDMYHAVNFNHPEVQEYFLEWIRRYVRDYRVDGLFWDCGGSPLAPDFAPPETRPFQRFPSESMVGGLRFLEKVMLAGRECSPDFFMWHECFSQDIPGHCYASSTDNEDFLFELNRHGRRRLVFRCHSAYNLYGGFTNIVPGSDTHVPGPVTCETYRRIAADPMNRWLVRFVREHGVRDAVGIVPGVAFCKGHIVVDPCKDPLGVCVPPYLASPRSLRNALTGEVIAPTARGEGGVTFRLPGGAPYVVE